MMSRGSIGAWAGGLLLSAVPVVAQAQTGTISGRVVDSTTSQAIVGASVVVAGTQLGAQTRDDGSFTIAGVPAGAQSLRVSRIGFRQATVPVTVASNGTVSASVTLAALATQLSGVVTVAYSAGRTQEQRNVTGSVAAVDTTLFNKGRVVSAEQLIQAKVPGVQVVSSNEPGGGIRVRVRGQASVNGATDPLFVVDGIPLPIGGGLSGGRNALNFLNPNDIANVTVLKDAQATAIYGSRGANGVVLITTKTGGAGSPQVTYGANYSSRTVARAPEVLDASQLRAAVQEFAPNNARLLGSANTDWFDALKQTGGGQEHNFAVAGARQDLQYRLSVGYLEDEGVLRGDRTTRVSGQFNYADRLLRELLDVQATLRGVRTRDVFGGGRFLGSALFSAPTNPIYNSDGTFFATSNVLEPRNPLAQLAGQISDGQADRGIGNLEARLHAPFLEGLSATVRGSFDAARTLQRTFTPTTDPAQLFVTDTLRGNFFQNLPDATTLVLDAYGSYNRQSARFGGVDVDLTGGYSYETFRGDNASFTASGLGSNALGIAGIPSARLRPIPQVNIQESRLASFFGRANVTLADRYLLGVSVRRDGSSRFGTNNQWGTFPAVSLGWRLSQERFFQLPGVSDLKLRYSYGLNGNQPTGNYTAYSTYTYSGVTSQVQFGNAYVPTVQPSVANPDLKWEESTTHNAGLDYGFLDGRVTGSLDYYNKLTTNLLFNATVPGGSNFNNRLLQNIGSLRNAGVEAAVNLDLLRGAGQGLLGRLRYEANFNASTNRNRLLSISTTGGQVSEIPTGQIGLGGDFVQTLRPGLPIYTYRVYRVQRDASGNPKTGAQTALNPTYYVDQNGDNKIDNADLVPFHSPQPRWVLGHTSNFGYGRVDLNFTLRSYVGYYTYNRVGAEATYSSLQQSGVVRNVSALVYRNGFINPQFNSELNVEKADFLRMDNVTLGYALPRYKALGSSRVFATLQNAFTATGYSGIDPLAGAIAGATGGDTGIDNNAYPLSRILTLGFTVGF
jgi:TonB-dependent starch-binding outer membrane protein SusC